MATDYRTAFWISAFLAILAIASFLMDLSVLWISDRVTAALILVVACLGALGATGTKQTEGRKRLADLRLREPQTYLAEIKESRDDTFYLAELHTLDPVAYDKENDRRTEALRIETQRRDEARRLEQERKAAADKQRLAELRAKVDQIKTASMEQRLDFYTEMANLAPESEIYRREKDKARKEVEDKESKIAKERAIKERLSAARRAPEDFVSIKNVAWRKGGFGSVMLATFTIRNEAPIDIKDIEIYCSHFAASGTRIDSNDRTIYEIVKANSTRTFRQINMGFIHSQAASTSCSVRSARAL